MYNLETVVKFIEKNNNIKLCEYQKTILQAILEGKSVSCPIMSGKRLLINGFNDYIKSVYDKHLCYNEAEVHVTLKDVIKEQPKRFTVNTNIGFKQEYECIWLDDKDFKNNIK